MKFNDWNFFWKFQNRFHQLETHASSLEKLFDNHERWIMLIIVKEQRALMMSENRCCEMQFYVLHVEHRLHILSLKSCVFFTKNSFRVDLFEIKMSLILEMHILSKWLYRLILMTMIILDTQSSIFETNVLDFDHAKSISFEGSPSASSLQRTLRIIQLKWSIWTCHDWSRIGFFSSSISFNFQQISPVPPKKLFLSSIPPKPKIFLPYPPKIFLSHLYLFAYLFSSLSINLSTPKYSYYSTRVSYLLTVISATI